MTISKDKRSCGPNTKPCHKFDVVSGSGMYATQHLIVIHGRNISDKA